MYSFAWRICLRVYYSVIECAGQRGFETVRKVSSGTSITARSLADISVIAGATTKMKNSRLSSRANPSCTWWLITSSRGRGPTGPLRAGWVAGPAVRRSWRCRGTWLPHATSHSDDISAGQRQRRFSDGHKLFENSLDESQPFSKTKKYILTILQRAPSALWRRWFGVSKNPVCKNEVLVWLSVWSEVQVVCKWSSWCHCHPKTP